MEVKKRGFAAETQRPTFSLRSFLPRRLLGMKRLRLYFVTFFVLLAVPCAILLMRTYSNLEQESFFFYRKTAQGVMASLGQSLRRNIESEESRPYTQYRYFHVADQPVPQQEGLNLSPLAAFPVQSEIPGILGYFQIDPDGSFHTPLLPDGEPPVKALVAEPRARSEVRDQMASLLGDETFHISAAFSPPGGPGGIQLKSGKVEDLTDTLLKRNLKTNLDQRLERDYLEKETLPDPPSSSRPVQDGSSDRLAKRLQKSSPTQALVFESQMQQAALEESGEKKEKLPSRSRADLLGGSEAAERVPEKASENRTLSTPELRDDWAAYRSKADIDREVTAEVDPFRTKLLDEEWLAFYRKVWWHDRRYIQGFVANLREFLRGHLGPAFQNSALPEGAAYLVFYRGEPFGTAGAGEGSIGKPQLLLSSDLPHPFSDFHLAVTVPGMPKGSAYRVVNMVALFLVLLVVFGLFGMYRITSTQIELSQKKSDFVSAVSHELNTPLASIRMYGEMLVEGWVEGEEKKRSYYRHIHDESERLSRLVQNVLCLAELERNEWPIHPADHDPVQFVEGIAQRLNKQADQAGFELATLIEGEPGPIRIDPDAMTQILINLIDNAIKFSKGAATKKVILRVNRVDGGCLIGVRDFGPGIPRRKLKRIFEKFYRLDNEMTRRTRGTGIGLALVKMLADAMGAQVEAANRRPGAEFSIRFLDGA